MPVRFTIRVRPGASRTVVGGRYADDALVVTVAARAVDGAANRAVIAALAQAFSVREREVQIVAGTTARSKVIEIQGDDVVLAERRTELLGR